MVRTLSLEKSGMKKGTWTPEEDEKLIAYVTRYGCWNWRQLPRFAGLARCGKSCRLRWLNYLRPDIKRGNYTKEEEDIIVRLHHKLGSRWSVIAANLPGRTDNDIKNHWNSNLKKRFQRKSKVTPENVKDTNKPNLSGSKQDTESEQNNVGFFQVVTPQTNPLSPQLSSSEFSSNENLVADDFGFMDAFTQQPMNEDIWSESFLAELMPDNGDYSTFQGSDSAMQIPDSRASSPQSSNSECLVVENEHFGFVEPTQPAVENSCIEMCVADMSHVPNELFAPFVQETDEYFCPMYYDDVDLWNQSDFHNVHVGLF